MNIGVFSRWMSSRENTNKRFVHSPNDRLFQKTTARSKVVDGSKKYVMVNRENDVWEAKGDV